MNILITPSKYYFKYVYVLLKSLFVNNTFLQEEINIYIYCINIDEVAKSTLISFCKKQCEKANVHFFSDMVLTCNSFKTSSIKPKEVYFKLYCIDNLPKDVDRILYLDVDTVINGSLERLYNIQFKEEEYVAVCGGIGFEDKVKSSDYMFDLNQAIKGSYFNSGVILFNLAAIRKKGITTKTFLDIAAQRKDYWYDQGILNYVFCNNAVYVPTQMWNYRFGCFYNNKRYNYREAPIIHYSRWKIPYKPWDLYFEKPEIKEIGNYNQGQFKISDMLNEMFSVWWKYADMLEEVPIDYRAEMNCKKEWYKNSLEEFLNQTNSTLDKWEDKKVQLNTVSRQLELSREWINLLLKEKIKLALLGSCFSRVSMMGQPYFNSNYKDYVDLKYIFYHSSYVSLMTDKIDYDTTCRQTKNDAFRRSYETWAQTEFDKSFFEQLKAADVDYLIIDNYADACYNIVETAAKSYFTKNYFISDADVLDDFADTRIVKWNSDEKWDKLAECICRFYDQVQEIIPLNRIVLVKGRLSEKRIISGKIVSWDNVAESREKNKVWEKIDNYIIEKYPEIRVVDMTNTKYVSADDFPLGNSWSHYQSDWYRDEFYLYNKIFMEDMCGK